MLIYSKPSATLWVQQDTDLVWDAWKKVAIQGPDKAGFTTIVRKLLGNLAGINQAQQEHRGWEWWSMHLEAFWVPDSYHEIDVMYSLVFGDTLNDPIDDKNLFAIMGLTNHRQKEAQAQYSAIYTACSRKW